MNNYKGLFTFDVDNHRYVPVEQADGIISDMFYNSEEKEESKKHYYITSCGEIAHRGYRLWKNESVYDKKRKEIGNYFESEEEGKKAVEKLRAWKRLKENGFRFTGLRRRFEGDWYKITFNKDQSETWIEDNKADLDLLFGGEE